MIAKEEISLVQKFLSEAVKNGYRAYNVEGHNTFGYLITPNDNVLVVNKGDFGGVKFTFAYIPSRETGSGCSCKDEAIYDVNMDLVPKLERDGKEYAEELHAKLYKNSQQWYESNYWQQKGLLKEVK